MKRLEVKNFGDVVLHFKGMVKEEEIRTIEVEGIVDTGAAYLCLPPKEIKN